MVEHYRNQNQGNYNANTTVDPLTWALMRFSEATGFWVFKVPHLIPMRLGFLFMVAAFVISVVHATGMKGARALGIPVETPQVAESSWKFSFPSLKVPEVQLPQVSLPSFTKAQRPPFRFVMPPDELYQINEDRTANKFSNDVIARGTKYYQYNAPDDRGRSVLEVQEELCAAVPAGKDVYFLTQIPPTHWHNMEKGVVYVKKFNHYTFTDWKDALFGSGSFHLVREDPIEVVTADWKRVWKKDLIKMRALTSPETGKGGVVCFIEE